MRFELRSNTRTLIVCAEAGDARAAAELAVSERPDVCVLDVMMPEDGGIRAVRDISRDLPDVPILMLSASRAGEDVIAVCVALDSSRRRISAVAS